MKYKTEIMMNGVVVASHITATMTPKNAVRMSMTKYIAAAKTKPDYLTIFVLNEIGQVWKYSVEKNHSGQYYIIPASNTPDVLTKNNVIDAFAGNTPIAKMKTR